MPNGRASWWGRFMKWFARRAPAPGVSCGQEQRAWPRLPCEGTGVCEPAGSADAAPCPARVKDFSRGGIGLLVGRRFAPGALLRVELDAGAGGTTTVWARVVYVRPDPGGGWRVGCAHVRALTAKEVLAFLGAREKGAAARLVMAVET